jgi:hypothetical protein
MSARQQADQGADNEVMATAELFVAEGELLVPRHLKLLPGLVVVEETGEKSNQLEEPETLVLQALFGAINKPVTVAELRTTMGPRYRPEPFFDNMPRRTNIIKEDIAFLASGAGIPYMQDHFLRFAATGADSLYLLSNRPKTDRKHVGSILQNLYNERRLITFQSMVSKYRQEATDGSFKGRTNRKTWQEHSSSSLSAPAIPKSEVPKVPRRTPPPTPRALIARQAELQEKAIPLKQKIQELVDADIGADFIHNDLVQDYRDEDRVALMRILRQLVDYGYLEQRENKAKDGHLVFYRRTKWGKPVVEEESDTEQESIATQDELSE